MKFVKMHGLGNDFILLDCLREADNEDKQGSTAEWILCREQVRQICDRHYGIGADGVVCILPSACADFRMKLYNADGSTAQMCGNGIRCLGKYVYDHDRTQKTELQIETDAGVRQLKLYKEADRISTVRVDMGTPDFVPEHIPVRFSYMDKYARNNLHQSIREPLAEKLYQSSVYREQETIHSNVSLSREANRMYIHLGKMQYPFASVSTGNPHGIIWVNTETELRGFPLERYGPEIEHNVAFPEGTNVEVAWIQAADCVHVRVWERGCGETKACGTGACAVAAAAMRMRKCGPTVKMQLPGGKLRVDYGIRSRHLYLTGPAEEICAGVIVIR